MWCSYIFLFACECECKNTVDIKVKLVGKNRDSRKPIQGERVLSAGKRIRGATQNVFLLPHLHLMS